MNYNWSILYNDPSSLSTSIELSKSSVFAAKNPLPLLVVFFPPMPLLWYCFYTKQYKRRGIGGKKPLQRPAFILYFVIFTLKMKLFWSSYEILKNDDTICDPYQIFLKIFSFRHHGVKSFWTNVGGFPPMPIWLGLISRTMYTLIVLL